jgi:cation diffusion facilitator family transporter
MENLIQERASLTRYAWLSIGAAVLTIALKGGAYLLTGSVGLLSDALESVVNLFAAIMALGMLIVAARPPDENHEYGHNKAEYFASGFEGALILVAAVSIGWAAWQRLLDPEPIERVGIGLAVSVVASFVNWWVARLLFRAGRAHHSITLEADAHHLMTDVWTSAGVLLGVGAAALTGWSRLDPLIALLVAANIIRMGIELMRRSVLGLLDTALPEADRTRIHDILEAHRSHGVEYHALRTRQAGARRFISVHILVPGAWTVQRGHHLLEEVEEEIRAALPGSIIFTHLEPLEDPVSWADTRLERRHSAPESTWEENADLERG